MDNLIRKTRPWWRFWKTEQEKKQDIIDMGYHWAIYQIVKETEVDKIRKWSSFPDGSEFEALVGIGIEKAIEEFQ